MIQKIIGISLAIFLAGCSSSVQKDTEYKNSFNSFVNNGNEVFFLLDYSEEYNFDATICKNFLDIKNIHIEDACIEPLSYKDDAFIHGVLKQKKPIGQRTYFVSDNELKQYNVYSIILEDEREYQSINLIENLPFEKNTMVKTKYKYIHTLNEMKRQHIMDDYQFTNDGILTTLGEDSHILTKEGLRSLNFLSEFIKPKDYNKALSILPHVKYTFANKGEPGYMTPIIQYENEDFLSLEYATTNLIGQEDVKTILITIESNKLSNYVPKSISFQNNNYTFNVKTNNFKIVNNFKVLTFDESEIDVVKSILAEKIDIIFEYENQNPVNISFFNEVNDLQNMIDGIKLFQLMEF